MKQGKHWWLAHDDMMPQLILNDTTWKHHTVEPYETRQALIQLHMQIKARKGEEEHENEINDTSLEIRTMLVA